MRGENQTVLNLVLSMAVVCLVAMGIYVFIPHDDSKDPIKTVNTRVEVDQVRRAAPYPVAAPEGLPTGWRATSVSYRGKSDFGAVWHLGYLTPDKEYIGVEQSDSPRADRYVADVTHKAKPAGGEVEVDGRKWTRYRGEKYDALVHKVPGATTVVTGTAPDADLLLMVRSLKIERGVKPSFPPSSAPTGKPSADAAPTGTPAATPSSAKPAE
ncbi:DUF4245 domain-containing protein [Streptomyces sp. 796.1]|uniref:DUF4245 domain-containing protein n=1 Tax=Streptomyces sp. 796.1 TaxID=3163029 RepID=UPI0039C96614